MAAKASLMLSFLIITLVFALSMENVKGVYEKARNNVIWHCDEGCYYNMETHRCECPPPTLDNESPPPTLDNETGI
ncbi:hypothetical protein M5689_007179 [Euphorbia peplus]|nr:hypothetical protein M5689_007179 [Euphorbia peplus]